MHSSNAPRQHRQFGAALVAFAPLASTGQQCPVAKERHQQRSTGFIEMGEANGWLRAMGTGVCGGSGLITARFAVEDPSVGEAEAAETADPDAERSGPRASVPLPALLDRPE